MMMLFRHKTVIKVLMYGVIVVFVGTIFFVWGAGGKLGGREPIALKINGDKITFRRFQQSLRQMAQRQKDRNVDPQQIKQQMIDEITRQYLLVQQVAQLDIDISDLEIDEEILKNDRELQWYQAVREQGYANAYRKEKKVNLGLQRMNEILNDLALVTDDEIRQDYRRKNEKVKIKYIQFPKHEFRKDVEISDEESEKYFQENKEKYQVEDRANIRFVKIDPKELVTDKDIEKYYAENKSEFTDPEKVKARHILLKVDSSASDDEKAKVKEKAQGILEEAKKEGADFAELAEEHSEGPTATKGGDLGFFERGKMVKSFEDVAFSLKRGEISALVETTFGYHIIKVEEKKTTEISPLQKVKSQIKTTIVEQVTAQDAKRVADELLYNIRVYTLENAIEKKRFMDSFTDDEKEKYSDLKLEVKTTGLFEKDVGSIPNVGSSWTYKSLIEKVFDMRKNAVATVEIKDYRGNIDSYFVVELTDKKPAHIPDFSEVKDNVKDDIKDEKSKELAFEAAEKLMAKLADGDSLEDLAKKDEPPTDDDEEKDTKKKEVKENNSFALSSSGYVPGVGRASKVMLAAFNLKPDEIAGPFNGNNGAFIIQLVEREEAVLKTLDEDKEEWVKTRQSLLQTQERQIYNNWYEGVKSQATIVDNTNAGGRK